MHALQQSYKGLTLVVILNSDRILFLLTMCGALAAGAWIGSL
jgi:hypothetical protein